MRYLVKAVKGDSDLLALEVEAADEAGITLHPELQGCTVLAVQPVGWSLRLHGKPEFPVMLFSKELLALLSAGLSLIEAIDTLVEKESSQGNRKLLEGVRVRLYQGQSLAGALEACPDVFSQFYVATIRASERTGSITEALARYVRYQEQADMVKKRVVSASVYPALLIGVGWLVSLFLMFYVVPRFSLVYKDLHGDVPFFSRLLLAWGSFVAEHAALLLGSFIVGAGVIAYWLSLRETRIWLAGKIQQIPAVGERVRCYQLARLYRTLGMLLRGGISVVTAIEMSKGVLGANLQGQLSNAGRAISEGVSVSQAMERNGLGTPVSLRMMRVGERGGQMGEMMERAAEFMDEELARWIDWFARLFEPLLMAGIGIVIGMIVVLMYMPIFELAGSIQ